MDSKFEHLTLRELGLKLCELSKEWILVFDTARDIQSQLGFVMEITKAAKRDNCPDISEHMDAHMENGVEF